MNLPDFLDHYSVDLMDPDQRLAVLAVLAYILEASSTLGILERAHDTQVFAHQMGALSRAVDKIRSEST